MDIEDRLDILADAAKYDVSCSSSGSSRPNRPGGLGNAHYSGICHSWTADGRCISLLKILMTNSCIYDCEYCVNRRSNDTPRAMLTPEEIVLLTIEFYRRNYIEGLFLSSGIVKSPDYTTELLIRTAKLLREREHFNGYIHMKGIPGTDPKLLNELGRYVDRVSVNIELPSEKSLHLLAPQKTKQAIMAPMKFFRDSIRENKEERKKFKRAPSFVPAGQTTQLIVGASGESDRQILLLTQGLYRKASLKRVYYSAYVPIMKGKNLPAVKAPLPSEKSLHLLAPQKTKQAIMAPMKFFRDSIRENKEERKKFKRAPSFVPAGQTTQLIVGASGESDRQILLLTQGLYRKASLKRVYYSAYVPIMKGKNLPAVKAPPLMRENRLYQADWLLRFYHFDAEEILSPEEPDFDEELDPKCCWALRHRELFPVEVNRAPYEMILRVPGIGVRSALRIMRLRHYGTLNFEDLKNIGVVMKRARYFVTINGKYSAPGSLDGIDLRNALISGKAAEEVRQMSLFGGQA